MRAMFLESRHQNVFRRVISAALAFSLFFSDPGMAQTVSVFKLSVPSPFSGKGDAGEISPENFRNSAFFLYIASIIGKYMDLGISEDTIKNHIKSSMPGKELALLTRDDPFSR